MLVSDLPERYQQQVAQQSAPRGLARAEIERHAPSRVSAVTPGKAPATKARLRQSGRKPNKLEADFQSAMKHRGVELVFEAITLKLANGARFTPDFADVKLMGAQAQAITFYETKGPQFEEDARVKLKVAAFLYPCFRFVLVTQHKELSDPWVMEAIRP